MTGHEPFFQATGVGLQSADPRREAAPASGFLNAAPDSDGILRRVPLSPSSTDASIPSLALAAVDGRHRRRRHRACASSNVNAATSGQSAIDSRRSTARATCCCATAGRSARSRTSRRPTCCPATASGDALQGKIVFVGTTALGTREVVATPLDTLFAGVEVQATVADNLLQRDFIRRPAIGATLESVTVLVLGIAIVLLVAQAGIVAGIVGGGARRRRALVGRNVAAVGARPVRLAAGADDRRAGDARRHDAGEVHGRTRPRRHRRPGKGRQRSV